VSECPLSLVVQALAPFRAFAYRECRFNKIGY
jgi:hypothetical protein